MENQTCGILIWGSFSVACIATLVALIFRLRLKKQFQELTRNQESLEFALESGHMGTWDLDLIHDTVSCSKEMLELWGVDPQTFQGQRSLLQGKVHPEDLDRMNEALNAAIKDKSVYELEYRLIPTPGIVRWVVSRGRYVFDPKTGNPTRFAGVIYDITEKKKREEALAEAMKARDQLFMAASHELRTPLTSLQLLLQVNQWDLNHHFPEAFTAEKISLSINKQLHHLNRITRIVDHILDETRISEGRFNMHFEEFDLGEMTEYVLDGFKITADFSDVKILSSIPKKIVGTWDRFRLEQVLLNLLMNGVRYGNKNPLYIELKKDHEKAYLTVKDEGIGIRLEDQDKIFNCFERVSPAQDVRGMGLGLFISHNIIKRHGGEILLKSELGKGSEFTIVLPMNSLSLPDPLI